MQISDWSVGLGGLFVYFLPFLIAALRDHKNAGPIFIVNLLPAALLLFSPPLLSLATMPVGSAVLAAVVAWFVALAWACTDDGRCAAGADVERR